MAKKHFMAKNKIQAIMRLFRGEDLDTVSRELGITVAMLVTWRDTFLEGGEKQLKIHSKNTGAEDSEIRKLKEKLGEQTMENELLKEKIARLEKNRPFLLKMSRY